MAEFDIKISDELGLNKITIDRCQEFEVVSITTFAKKPIVSKDSPTIDDDAWVGEPREYTFEGYVTATHRRNLEARKEDHDEVRIYEEDDEGSDVEIDRGYITSLKSEWRGNENYDYPWYVTITIISSDKI